MHIYLLRNTMDGVAVPENGTSTGSPQNGDLSDLESDPLPKHGFAAKVATIADLVGCETDWMDG